MEKHTIKQRDKKKDWLLNFKGSIFGIVYRDMIKNNKKPL